MNRARKIKLVMKMYSAQPFDPKKFGPVRAWWDAADQLTMTLSGQSVTAWRDAKNGVTLTQAAVTAPVMNGSQINGIEVPRFTGLDKSLEISAPTGLPTGTSNRSVFAVYQPIEINDLNLTIASFGARTQDGCFSLQVRESQLSDPAFAACGTSLLLSGKSYVSEPKQACAWSPLGTTVHLFADGEERPLGTSGQRFPYDTVDFFAIGKTFDLLFFNGMIGDVIITDGSEGPGGRQKIEGFLAWKYGIQTRLPVWHPYRDKPPTM